MILSTVVLVYFAMPPQVGYNRKVAAAALNFTCKGYNELVWKDQ
jgi:hypothetical protein